MFKISTSYRDDWNCYKSLSDACYELRSSLDLPIEDVRVNTINNLEKITQMTGMLLNPLICTEEASTPTTLHVVLKLYGYGNSKGGSEFLQQTAKYLKLAHITAAQFQIEHLIDSLDTEISGPSKQPGFFQRAQRLLASLQLSDPVLDELTIPARIRNSLHNNGQHRGADFDVTIQGIRYSASSGDYIDCATRPHCAHALENSVTVIESILSHPSITKIAFMPRHPKDAK